MKPLDSKTLDWLCCDLDAREERLREVIAERLAEQPAPVIEDQIVATYFLAHRTMRLDLAGEEIAYHATSGTHDPPPGSLLAQCTARTVGVDAFDASGQIGLVHVAFPLKMMLHPDGGLTSTDILHTAAGAIIFDVYERKDAQLVLLQIPEPVIRQFPGPTYGPAGLRRLTNFAPQESAFGTILKPTAGITPDQVGELVGQAAECDLFLFVKEDENLYPDLDYSPVVERTRQAVAAIERARSRRGDKGLIFAPHIGGLPSQVVETTLAVLEAGASGVMFSETFAGGTVRMVREATRHLDRPPAIYGHNAGIGTRARCIRREVIDLLARLEGIDFRQTAPVKPGPPFLKPYGAEWIASEQVLSKPLPGIRPTMIVRAGGLDQGNIGLNLADAERQGITQAVLFLAGSAIHEPSVTYHDFDQMLADPQVEAAIIAVADQFHVDLCLKAVAAGKHVLVEKPLGVGIEECERLQQATRERNVILQVGHNRRFDPGMSFARRFVREEMGEVMALKAWYCDSTYRYTMTDNLQPVLAVSTKARRPEGNPKENKRRYFMLGHGSHLVDTARFLGGEIVSVRARLVERFGAYCWFVMADFANGSVGHLDLTIAVRGDFSEGFTIYGEHGSVHGVLPLTWYHKSSYVECLSNKDGIFRRPLGADAYTYKLQIEGFADSILNGTPLQGASVEDGVASVRAMVAIARSAETKELVRLADVTGAV